MSARLFPPPNRDVPIAVQGGVVSWQWLKFFQTLNNAVAGMSEGEAFAIDPNAGAVAVDSNAALALIDMSGAGPSETDAVMAGLALAQSANAAGVDAVLAGMATQYPATNDQIFLADTHANRAKYSAMAYAAGSIYFETDTKWVYVNVQSGATRAWTYAAGLYVTSSSPATVAAVAPALTTTDVGALMGWATYSRVYRWTGTAWERAPGEDPGNGTTRMFGDFSGAPGTGWALCDGSVVTVTNNDGTTGSFTTPNFNGYYAKAAAAYTGAQVASTVPTGIVAGTFTGAPMASHTHNMPISLDTGTPQVYISDTYGTGSPNITAKALIAATADTTAALAPLEVSDASAGTPAGVVTATFTGTTAGEPAHIDILKYVRL